MWIEVREKFDRNLIWEKRMEEKEEAFHAPFLYFCHIFSQLPVDLYLIKEKKYSGSRFSDKKKRQEFWNTSLGSEIDIR